ncbi:MAG TPA: substrate-binding domain-containing protein [Rhizomicrobium sp.]|nr:substrate-binding domain-containing protein [Rhizomicrobium sp.]
MLKLRNLALATACTWIAGAMAFAPEASAQTYTRYDIFGGGASVPAPYARQTFDCYANPADLIIAGSPPQFDPIAPFDYTGKPPQNCATQHITKNGTIWYVSTSAGPGILSVFGHDPTFYGYVNQQQTQYFPSVQFALSTTPLGTTDVGVYNNGGTETQGKTTITVAAPGALASCAGIQNGVYPNPLQCFGPLIQFPFAITPIAFAYNSIYEKWVNSSGQETDYHFNIQYKRQDGSGGLRLSPTTYCEIFNGGITNWNDPALTADNGGVSLQDPNDKASPFSVPLQIVGRSDSSGATSIFTRHLANVCAGISGNQYTTGVSTLPASLQGPTYNVNNPNYPAVAGETAGKFTLAPNNSGVAQYTAFTAVPSTSLASNCTYSGAVACIQLGRITYSGTDYVLPYVADTQLNTYNLNSTTLENFSGQWEDPTPDTAQTAYSVIQPPQSNSKNGKYCPSCTNFGMRSDPTAWVQSNSPNVPIADPTTSGAYPVVGTANWLTYTCYASKNQEKSLFGVVKYVSNAAINYDENKGILSAAGLAPLSKVWRNAIKSSFLSDQDKLGLGFGIAQVTAGACSQKGVVGG